MNAYRTNVYVSVSSAKSFRLQRITYWKTSLVATRAKHSCGEEEQETERGGDNSFEVDKGRNYTIAGKGYKL